MRLFLAISALCAILLGAGCDDPSSGGGAFPEPSSSQIAESPRVMWIIRREEGIDTSHQSAEDSHYALVDMRFIHEVHRRLRASGLRYKDEIADCDDFARKAHEIALEIARENGWDVPPAFAVIHSYNPTDPFDGDKHALCLFVDQNRKVWFYDPQNGKIWVPSKEDRDAVYFYLLS